MKVGDFVRRKSDGKIVQLDIVKDGWVAYREERLITGACPMEEVEPYDPKTAFLSELKGLLEKYGACIYDDEQYKLIIEFNNGDSLAWKWSNKSYDESKLTPDNIMDYDKE